MLEPSELNTLARAFHQALVEAFPDIAARAIVDRGEGVERGSLLVRYAPDRARPECMLLITTDRGEVTVGFGMYHSHFAWPNDEPEEPALHPLAFLAALVNDRLVVEAWIKDGRWVGSRTSAPGETPDPAELAGHDLVTHRSWSGKLDREFTPAGTGTPPRMGRAPDQP